VTRLFARIRSIGKGSGDALARGIRFYQNKEYLKAYDAWRQTANERFGPAERAEAQYRIGGLYARGEGVLRSVPDCVAWYRQAADSGHAEAQFQLGLIRLQGSPGGGPCKHWFDRASARDEAAARSTLELLFPHGLDVAVDAGEGRRWIEAAANGGKPEAQALLGGLYKRGHGCTRDYDAARRWYLAAAQHGIAAAEFSLGDIFFQGLGVTVDHATAAYWYEKAA
jgi:uncharacterized protein